MENPDELPPAAAEPEAEPGAEPDVPPSETDAEAPNDSAEAATTEPVEDLSNTDEKPDTKPEGSDAASEDAAIKVQSMFRGYATRKSDIKTKKRQEKVERAKKTEKSAVAIQARARGYLTRKKKNQKPLPGQAEAAKRAAMPVEKTQEQYAALKVQSMYRGFSTRKKDVVGQKRAQKAGKTEADRELAKAATEIQRHFRGFKTRKLSDKQKELQKLEFRERHEATHLVSVEDLHKTTEQIDAERFTKQADEAALAQAAEIKAAAIKDEQWAAVKIQSMYRGFSSRAEQQKHRNLRTKTEGQFREHWQQVALAEESTTQSSMKQEHVFSVNVTSNRNQKGMRVRTDHLTPDGERLSLLATKQKLEAKQRELNMLTPEQIESFQYHQESRLPTDLEVRAMEMIKLATLTWSNTYVMHIEPAADSSVTDQEILRFTSVWSSPALHTPVPKTIVYVHFTVPRDSVEADKPVISYRVENQVLERVVGDTKGVPLHESWIDRVVADKQQLKTSFYLAA